MWEMSDIIHRSLLSPWGMGPLICLLQAREEAWPLSALGQGYGELGNIGRWCIICQQALKGTISPSLFHAAIFPLVFILELQSTLYLVWLMSESKQNNLMTNANVFLSLCAWSGGWELLVSQSTYIFETLFVFNLHILIIFAHLHNCSNSSVMFLTNQMISWQLISKEPL